MGSEGAKREQGGGVQSEEYISYQRVYYTRYIIKIIKIHSNIPFRV